MSLAIEVVLIMLAVLNIVVHSIGLYLLVSLYKYGNDEPQYIYIINLSATLLAFNICWFLLGVINVIAIISIPLEVGIYISIITSTVFIVAYYMTLAGITIDRFLEVLLNIKYTIYCGTTKAKLMVSISWFIAVVMTIATLLMHELIAFNFEIIVTKYVYPIADFLFILIAVVSYSFIFHRYKATRNHPSGVFRKGSRRKKVSNSSQSSIVVFRQSRFYVSACLVLNFIVLVAVPDLIFLVANVDNHEHVHQPAEVLMILYNVSFLGDAWVYIFLHPPVRRLLWKKIRAVPCLCNCAPNKQQGSRVTRYTDDHDRWHHDGHGQIILQGTAVNSDIEIHEV